MSLDALFIYGSGVTLVVPRRGDPFYLRESDGAVGTRSEGVVSWHVVVEDLLAPLQRETTPAEILAMDGTVERLRHTIDSFRGGL